jgi:hypothetical protein
MVPTLLPGYGNHRHRRMTPVGGKTHLMDRDALAQLIVESIDRHGLRGLIYGAEGLADVVMHGHVNMLAVADDLLIAFAENI